MPHRELVTRRNLPHWFVPGAAHFVTFRLAGSLPAVVLEDLRERKALLLRHKPKPGTSTGDHPMRIHKQLFAAYDHYLDHFDHLDGVRHLADVRIAAMVRSSLYFHNKSRYNLHAYSIMPNHVHVLLQPVETSGASDGSGTGSNVSTTPLSDGDDIGEQPDERSPLASIMHSLKSYTA